MKCLICNHESTKVVDSRIGSDGYSIRRRRECEKCGFRFSTVEESDILDLTVVKRDGTREPYNREKLEAGIRIALKKRPHGQEEFRALIQKIERAIQERKRPEMTSEDIGEIILKHLKGFDHVAYIRFASVYESFQDIESFAEFLRGIKKVRSKNPHYAVNKHS